MTCLLHTDCFSCPEFTQHTQHNMLVLKGQEPYEPAALRARQALEQPAQTLSM